MHARDLDLVGAPHAIDAKKGRVVRGRLEAPEGLDEQLMYAFLEGPIVSPVIGTWGVMAGAVTVDVDHETGRFEIVGVPPGTWTLHVWGDVEGKSASWETTVRASDDDVVIRLTPETADFLD